MKFCERLLANAVAIYLALYLVDSVANGRFLVGDVWIAVFLAVILGFGNSLVRPLHRIRTQTLRALLVAVFTLLVNAVVLQIFAWTTPLAAANAAWVLLMAAFVSVLAGLLNWLIGFSAPAKSIDSEWTLDVPSPKSPTAKSQGTSRRPANNTRRSSQSRR